MRQVWGLKGNPHGPNIHELIRTSLLAFRVIFVGLVPGGVYMGALADLSTRGRRGARMNGDCKVQMLRIVVVSSAGKNHQVLNVRHSAAGSTSGQGMRTEVK
jgi:hypothetical protein